MSRDFLERWARQDEHAQVALLSAPGTFPPAPSIALSIFQAVLDSQGISSRAVYASFPMAHLLGQETIDVFYGSMDFLKNLEYLFAHLTDVPATAPIDQFVKTCTFKGQSRQEEEALTSLLKSAISCAEEVVEATAERIIHMGARVVAATSVFSQQCPTLAILRRVKELDPSISTILGGYNTSGEMGMNVLRHFPSVDYVCFGEADEIIAETIARLLAQEDGPMPYGIVRHGEPLPEPIPYRMTKDLNIIPTPTYRDFFEETDREAAGFYGESQGYSMQSYEQVVFLEGSRGCWWGARHPCSFCGLNGLSNVYREKTPERLYQEIQEAAELYPSASIHLADNILSQRMIKELLPLLAENPIGSKIFCEIKANLSYRETLALSKARFAVTQPGIESLNDHLLQLMGKGSSAIQNIALLKYHQACRMYPVWNMMTNVPGERREDYEQMLELMPLIVHLRPPTRANPIVFMRFSRYCDHQKEHGLVLQPDPLYECCFPGREDIIRSFGCYYILAGGPFVDTIRENRDLYAQIHHAVAEWRRLFYSREQPQLIMSEGLLGLAIKDTRPCAPEERRLLLGISADVYRLASQPVSLSALTRQLPGRTEDEVRSACEDLVRKKLMLFLSNRYLALAVPSSSPSPLPTNAHGEGHPHMSDSPAPGTK